MRTLSPMTRTLSPSTRTLSLTMRLPRPSRMLLTVSLPNRRP